MRWDQFADLPVQTCDLALYRYRPPYRCSLPARRSQVGFFHLGMWSDPEPQLSLQAVVGNGHLTFTLQSRDTIFPVQYFMKGP